MRKATPLSRLRKTRTLSQREMARLLRIGQQTYSKYESGTVRAPAHIQAHISAILGLPIADVFPALCDDDAVPAA